VEEALKAQLPIRSADLEKHFESLWLRWDQTGTGNLSLRELFRPKDGLLDYLRIAKVKENCRDGVDTTYYLKRTKKKANCLN
jgi:hypothetical protein